MATAGFNYAVPHPVIWIGKLDPITGRGPQWPARNAVRSNVAAMKLLGWERWWGMNDGLSLTVNDPQAVIGSSDRGTLGQVSTGAHGIALASQTKTPIQKFVDWFTKQATKSLAAVGGTPEVETLTLAGTTAAASGNAVVVLDNEVYTVPITAADTPTLAATALRNPANYTPALAGWTLSGATTNVIYTATSAGAKTGTFSASLPSALTGSFAETTPGVNPTSAAGEVTWFDPNGEYGSVQRFTVIIEGVMPAGSLNDYATFVRTIVHQVNQGGNTVLRYDDSGTNAPFAINLAGQAEPRKVSALEMLNTGFDYNADQDPYGKATVWRAPLLAA